MQAFPIIYSVFAPRAPHGGLGVLQLLQRGERAFIGEIVLARLHGLDAQRAPLAGHGCRGHQANAGIFQNFLIAARGLGIGKFAQERLHFFGVGIVHPFELRSRLYQPLALPIDMAMLQKCRRKRELALFHGLCAHVHRPPFLSSMGIVQLKPLFFLLYHRRARFRTEVAVNFLSFNRQPRHAGHGSCFSGRSIQSRTMRSISAGVSR